MLYVGICCVARLLWMSYDVMTWTHEQKVNKIHDVPGLFVNRLFGNTICYKRGVHPVQYQHKQYFSEKGKRFSEWWWSHYKKYIYKTLTASNGVHGPGDFQMSTCISLGIFHSNLKSGGEINHYLGNSTLENHMMWMFCTFQQFINLASKTIDLIGWIRWLHAEVHMAFSDLYK